MWRYLIAAFVYILIIGPPAGAQDNKPGWTIPEPLKWSWVNGYPITYREEGQGQAIVLIHGALSDSRTFNRQLLPFAKSHRVIAVHLRHHFPEAWNGVGSDFSVEQHALDVAGLIKKLDLGKVHIVGHSRGGAVAVEIAKTHPEVVRTLVLADASIDMPVPETPEAIAAAGFNKKVNETLKDNLKSMEPAKAAEIFIDSLSSNPGAWAKLPEAGRKMILDNIYTVLGERERPITTCDHVRKFETPVLLLTGEMSASKFEFFYNEMRKCKSLPQTVVVPKVGHAMQLNAEFFNKVVLDFVAMN
jgi:pimeloyl-ACP methyl ester carboxylesterase